jgi:hypothetical protein
VRSSLSTQLLGKAGVIQLATAGVAAGEKPAAWFSTNPVWEASANRGNIFWDARAVGDVAVGLGVPSNTRMLPFDLLALQYLSTTPR